MPGGAIYEDDLLCVSHIGGEEETYLGYLMVESKRHIPGVAELTDLEAQMIGQMVSRLGRALKASEGVDHVYIFVLGDHVPHLHVHVVGRYPGAPREYWGVRVDEWPEAPRGREPEIAALVERLRFHLHSHRIAQG